MSDGHDNGGHDHGVAENADTRYLAIALGMLTGFMVVEVIVAFVSGSLALLADAGHMLTDVAALAGAIIAARLAAAPARGAWTYGFKRAETLSGAINGITLLLVAVLVAYEAVRRLIDPPPVAGRALLIVAIVGVAVNLAATWVLAKANRSSLNVEGAFQHTITDAYAFIATVIAGVVILFTGWRRADPVASLVVVVLLLRASWGLLQASGRVLLEAAPEGVDLDEIRTHSLETRHVVDVHDLHVWTVTSDLPALSAHVVVQDCCFDEGHAPEVLHNLQRSLGTEFDVEHSTFQLEPTSHQEREISSGHA